MQNRLNESNTRFISSDRLILKLGLVTMRWKLFIEFCLTALIISILAGDLFLPQPYRSQSQQIRVDVNHFLLTLLPRQTIIDIQKKRDRHS